MNHRFPYRSSHEQLVKQLVYLDEEMNHLLDPFFPEVTPRRRLVEKTLSEYGSVLESVIKNTEDLHSVALIGSELDLLFLDDLSSESFTIVFPNQADPNRNRVSFLSPLGFQLLLARTNETCTLDIPSGETPVKVEGIRFVNQGFIK